MFLVVPSLCFIVAPVGLFLVEDVIDLVPNMCVGPCSNLYNLDVVVYVVFFLEVR